MIPGVECTGCGYRVDVRLKRCPLCGNAVPAAQRAAVSAGQVGGSKPRVGSRVAAGSRAAAEGASGVGAGLDAASLTPLYPNYQERLHRIKWQTLRRILLFSALVAALVLTVVNALTLEQDNNWWVLGILPILGYALITTNHTIFSSSHIALKVMVQVFALSGLLALTDVMYGWLRWSVNYAIPLMIMAATLFIFVMFVVSKVDQSNFFGYFFGLALIGLAPLALYLFGVATVLWPSLSASLLALCALLWVLFFLYKHLKVFVSSRLHI